ncbi:MAG TPA: hemolysin family protein [Thermoanaerobaculia bacterium]|nr:hemolysin family protein [Thermoanaerobaculia bacterium]
MGIGGAIPPAAMPPGGFELNPFTGMALALLLVALNGFFVAAEFALVKVRSTQIVAHGSSRSGRLARNMVEHLDAYLSACQLGITLASLALGWVGEPAVAHTLEPGFAALGLSDAWLHTVSLVLAFALITMLHIVLGELAPKTLAIRKPEATSLWVAIPLFVFYRVSYPAIWILNWMANAVLRLVGLEPVGEDAIHEEEEIRRLLASHQESRLPEHKRELLDNIFELSHRVARQVMVPRAEVVFLDTLAPIEESLAIARETGHTRFPLCEGDLDRTIGLVHIKDLFHAAQVPKRLEEIRREIFFIPETLSLERLLRRMRHEHLHMAAVLDEYGGVSGIVTLENVIEEIVGEIQDEFDAEKPELVKISDGVYQILGSMLIQDLEDELEVDLGDERDEDTLAGVALSELGRRARVGDRVTFGPLALEVVEVDRNRILSLRVKVVPRGESGEPRSEAVAAP